MNAQSLRKVLDQDLELLVKKRAMLIEEGNEKSAIDITRLIKDTMGLFYNIPKDAEEITSEDYNVAIDKWIKENMIEHLGQHNFDGVNPRLAYRTGFENALGLSKIIVEGMISE